MGDDRLDIYALGGLRLSLGERPLADVIPLKGQLLLIYLADRPEGESREQLATLLWDDRPQKQALSNLRTLLTQTRRTLGDILQVSRSRVALALESVWLDTVVFRRLLADSDDLDAAENALTLYDGPFLDGVLVRESRGLEAWLALERERLRVDATTARLALATRALRTREYENGIRHVTAVVEDDPLRESAHRLLMRLLARAGRHVQALRQFEACRRLLATELDVEVSEETARQAAIIRAARGGTRYRVPETTAPFVGRAAELAQIGERLDAPECRLLTLVGPGGIGKTRLAMEVGRARHNDYLQGVCFVPLEGATAPSEMVAGLATALGLRLRGQEAPLTQVQSYLEARHVLLILDNFEQLLPEGADLVQQIIESAPDVTLLVTCHQPLDLRAEWVVHIAELPVPAADESAPERFDAVRLFAAYGERSRSNFTVNAATRGPIAAICRLVDGIPLGLELAAAALRSRDLATVAADLVETVDSLPAGWRDMPARHRSLRAVFDYAWRLLSPEERELFRVLAVFKGGFTVAAATAVAGEIPLDTFVARSLINEAGDGRYTLHPVIGRFTAEKLAEVPAAEAEGRRRHTAFYLPLVAGQERALLSDGVTEATRLLAPEVENVYAAWETAVARKDWTLLVGALPALGEYHQIRGPLAKMASLCAAASEIVEDVGGDVTLLARLYLEESRCHDTMGSLEEAFVLANRALALASGDEIEQVALEARLRLGFIHFHAGRREEATAALQAVEDRARLAGRDDLRARSNRILADILSDEGEFERAEALCRAALAIQEAAGNLREQALCRNQLGNIALAAAPNEAPHHFETALASFGEIDDDGGRSIALNNLGMARRQMGDHAGAIPCYEEALAIFEQLGQRRNQGIVLSNLGNVALEQGNYGSAQLYYESARSLFANMGDRRAEGVLLNNLGNLAGAVGQFRRAVDYFKRSRLVRRETGYAIGEALTLVNMATVLYQQAAYSEAEALAREAADLLQDVKNEQHLSAARLVLGRALVTQEKFAAARPILAAALLTREEAGLEVQVLEVVGALCELALAEGDSAEAGRLARRLLAAMGDGTAPELRDAMGLFWVAVRALRAAGDEEAADEWLARAAATLRERARRIDDSAVRHSFLANVPAHRAIWEAAGFGEP